MKRKILTLLALVLVSVFSANAKVIRITEAEQASEFFALNGGDTLVLAEGVWENLEIKFRSIDGKRANPVVLRGETAGKTILKGVSSVAFSGEGVIVEDLYFEDPVTDQLDRAVISFRTSPAINATESVLRNVRITGTNTPLNIIDECKWVSIYGINNTVENCAFEDKSWRGTTLVIWPEPGYSSQPNHLVRNNYFTRPRAYFNDKGGKVNGQEIIRIGDSFFSMTDSRCVVEYNVFEECNGEIEIISSKSCNNIFRGNVFLACEGTLTLRHGNGAVVENNYFDGRNVPGTGGIRLIGEDNIVKNNYLQNLAGDNTSSAICIMMGVTESVLNSYYQVVNAIIDGNVVVDCVQSLCINVVNRANQEQPFARSLVTNNEFVSTKIAAEIFNIPAPEDVVWRNNIFEGGEFIGATPSELGAVSGTVERRAMPVFDFGPSWKNLYE